MVNPEIDNYITSEPTPKLWNTPAINLPHITTPGIPSVFREVELRKAALELLVSIAEDGNYTREDESKVGNAMQALQNILDT